MDAGIFDFKKMERRSNVDSAEVMQVIRTRSLVGKGTEDSVMRPLTEYWTLDGKLLARIDELYQ